jgi:CRP/FNR family cyclic AMP-dependent transcriptional regulator
MIDTDFLKSNDEIINQLMRIPALNSMDDEDLKELMAASQTKDFNTGDTIFEEGSMGKLIFYLVSGKVRITKNGHVLMTLQRTGDVFGEMGPIGGKTLSASVKALSDVNCIEIDLSAIDSKNKSDTHMFRYLIFRGFAEILAARLRYTTEQLLSLRAGVDELKKKS